MDFFNGLLNVGLLKARPMYLSRFQVQSDKRLAAGDIPLTPFHVMVGGKWLREDESVGGDTKTKPLFATG